MSNPVGEYPAGLQDLLMHVVCDTHHPDRQLQASRMLEQMQGASRPLPAAAPGEAVKAFREFLRVHPSVGCWLSGYEADDAALQLARIALDFGKTPNEADRRVAAAMGRAKVLRDMLELCIPWVREGIGADVERIAAIGASLEWTPSVLAAKLQDLLRDYDSEVARELCGQGGVHGK